MKKLLIAAIAAMLTITSCGGANNTDETPTNTPSVEDTTTDTQNNADDSYTILEYFPVRTNTNYHYESPIEPQLNQDVYVTYTNGSRIQRRAASADVSSTEVLQYQGGELRLVYGEPNFYFFENITAADPIIDMLLIKEPLVMGQKWNMDATGESEITGLDVPVTTPIQDYYAMEVTTKFDDGRQQIEYYARGAGLIKTVYTTAENRTIEIVLNSITENAALVVPVDFYFPDSSEQTGFGREERPVSISTDCDLTAIFNEQLKAAGTSGYILLPGNTVIDSINVDRANDAVILDLSDNDGVNTEEGIQAIADTLGHFYGTSKFRPTVNGGDYSADGKTYGSSDYIKITLNEDQAEIN